MNDNYLWDRTGEPDLEVLKLEELLEELRYQPQPLRIPPGIRVGRQPRYFSMAIAAAIALFALMLSFWLYFGGARPTPALKADRVPQIEPSTPAAVTPATNKAALSSQTDQSTQPRRQRGSRPAILARARYRQSPVRIQSPALTAEELAQKEQVMLALRMVSAKLNLAQRKSQSVPQLNMIRNQHRIG